MLEYWAPQGTKIQTVSADIQKVERRLMEDGKVASVSTFMGQGPPRFYLSVDPEKAYQSYAQVIINVHDLKGLNELIPEMDSWIQGDHHVRARIRVDPDHDPAASAVCMVLLDQGKIEGLMVDRRISLCEITFLVCECTLFRGAKYDTERGESWDLLGPSSD